MVVIGIFSDGAQTSLVSFRNPFKHAFDHVVRGGRRFCGCFCLFRKETVRFLFRYFLERMHARHGLWISNVSLQEISDGCGVARKNRYTTAVHGNALGVGEQSTSATYTIQGVVVQYQRYDFVANDELRCVVCNFTPVSNGARKDSEPFTRGGLRGCCWFREWILGRTLAPVLFSSCWTGQRQDFVGLVFKETTTNHGSRTHLLASTRTRCNVRE
mmetsp:Transcript_24684/g.38094  ORF Transcript_24684/g.38094 Transcript_24684/m.38094 type:complete len:215 (+) Transcript_24684:324-968(+)